eukprot:CAMPEP_0114506758 /NCGR_PEP_ID=MMETSP0109-20121206/11605_1 /TAXON_ID=29199 /ORGANISM="Chlorarachnion reptans, Strain CCCM449" /LENGTH=478 /DNA_ID=CAMNT_0001685381 /DNA_START=255 /DNA_END=1691 /DNA_ORIENTATION=-
MFYEFFLLGLGTAILTIKDVREITLGLILIVGDTIMWINCFLFGEPKATKHAISLASQSHKNSIRSSVNVSRFKWTAGSTSVETDKPTVPPRPKAHSNDSSSEKPALPQRLMRETVVTPDQKKKIKRRNAEAEMVECEGSYIGSLSTLQRVYQIPMEKQKKAIGIEQDDLQKIFSPMLSAIIQLHQSILEDFHKFGERKCGKVLNTKAPYFKMYTQYLNGYDRALDTIYEQRKKNRRFEKFLQKQRKGDSKEKRVWKYMDITSYLIMPVQRIPRYELLLKEIIKNTPANDPELQCLNQALGMVRDAAKHNNQEMKSYQDVENIVKIQSMLQGDLKGEIIKPYRALVHVCEGEVTTLSSAETESVAGQSCAPNTGSSSLSSLGSGESGYSSPPSEIDRTISFPTASPRFQSSPSHRRRQKTQRPSRPGSNNSAAGYFRQLMEEKLTRMKKLNMQREKCDIFIFSDLLVWVAKAEIMNRQ